MKKANKNTGENICPFCGETTKPNAKLCFHCQNGLTKSVRFWRRLWVWVSGIALIATAISAGFIYSQTKSMANQLQLQLELSKPFVDVKAINIYPEKDSTVISIQLKNFGKARATYIETKLDILDLGRGKGKTVPLDTIFALAEQDTAWWALNKVGFADSLAIGVFIKWTWGAFQKPDSSAWYVLCNYDNPKKRYSSRIPTIPLIDRYWSAETRKITTKSAYESNNKPPH